MHASVCGMQLEREKKSVCGVPIGDVVSRRIYRGAGKKGFGNARAVRNKLEQIISIQSQRIGTLKLRKQPVSERDYQMLTALDAIGPRPSFASCAPMRDLNAMAGLSAIKAEFRKLLLMAQQNYDREMRGDAPETISMHRVFYGNPGTGKSTVAKLYGALLKELGLLSKGDFIAVTPADLTGDAEGGAATNTKDVLREALLLTPRMGSSSKTSSGGGRQSYIHLNILQMEGKKIAVNSALHIYSISTSPIPFLPSPPIPPARISSTLSSR
jgi:hypothetical protein